MGGLTQITVWVHRLIMLLTTFDQGRSMGDKDDRDSRTLQGGIITLLGALAGVVWMAIGDPATANEALGRLFEPTGIAAQLITLVGVYVHKVGQRAAIGKQTAEIQGLRKQLEVTTKATSSK